MQSPVAVATLKRITDARFRHAEEGQDLLEFGLLATLVALAACGALATLGNAISGVFWNAIAAASF
jgi:Flp pilus assembly pilin Flp